MKTGETDAFRYLDIDIYRHPIFDTSIGMISHSRILQMADKYPSVCENEFSTFSETDVSIRGLLVISRYLFRDDEFLLIDTCTIHKFQESFPDCAREFPIIYTFAYLPRDFPSPEHRQHAVSRITRETYKALVASIPSSGSYKAYPSNTVVIL